MLQSNNISFRYGANHPWIVKNGCFNLKKGSIVGMYGHSGTGKTTFSRILSGYLQPCEGTITCDRQPFPHSGFRPVQLVFQNPVEAMNPYWTMEQILTEASPLDDNILDLLEIPKKWLARRPSELSGGELQRIALARVFNRNIHYIIADEITANLDAISQASIWKVFSEYARSENIGVLAISHDLALLEKVCDQTIHFSEISPSPGDS
ncbi:MAG: ATP-binding cassette domain-containing protein [Desulfobulbaceae bacterium]|nr:ATP-binding cassette domain-containing protein [Desulfobulbaceae bacterium]